MAEMKFDMSGGAAVIERDGRDRPARPADPRDRRSSARPRTCRRAASMRPGDVAARDERHDDRGHQHRRRGPARARRLPRPRRRARRRAGRRRRDADRRDRHHLRRTPTPACSPTTTTGRRRSRAAGERTGELTWRLPLHREYDELIKGTHRRPPQRRRGAQGRARSPPRSFLRRFVGDVPVGAPRHRRHGVGPRPRRTRRKGGSGLRRAPADRPRGATVAPCRRAAA